MNRSCQRILGEDFLKLCQLSFDRFEAQKILRCVIKMFHQVVPRSDHPPPLNKLFWEKKYSIHTSRNILNKIRRAAQKGDAPKVNCWSHLPWVMSLAVFIKPIRLQSSPGSGLLTCQMYFIIAKHSQESKVTQRWITHFAVYACFSWQTKPRGGCGSEARTLRGSVSQIKEAAD